jgi:hypothetical protein
MDELQVTKLLTMIAEQLLAYDVGCQLCQGGVLYFYRSHMKYRSHPGRRLEICPVILECQWDLSIAELTTRY